MSLLAAERALYQDIWTSVEDYAAHAPGEMYLPIFLSLVGEPNGVTVLDAGTGSGKGALALVRAGFDVRLCDVTDAGLVDDATALPFTNACLWHDLSAIGPVEYVYCTDVLEHVPPQFTMLAIRNLLAIANRGVFLTVSLVPDNFGVWAGKSLHQSVFPFTWWRDSLAEIGTVVDARDLVNNAVFLVEPR